MGLRWVDSFWSPNSLFVGALYFLTVGGLDFVVLIVIFALLYPLSCLGHVGKLGLVSSLVIWCLWVFCLFILLLVFRVCCLVECV